MIQPRSSTSRWVHVHMYGAGRSKAWLPRQHAAARVDRIVAAIAPSITPVLLDADSISTHYTRTGPCTLTHPQPSTCQRPLRLPLRSPLEVMVCWRAISLLTCVADSQEDGWTTFAKLSPSTRWRSSGVCTITSFHPVSSRARPTTTFSRCV